MNEKLKLALVQMEVSPGRPDENLKKILDEIQLAKKKALDVVIFPEMSVSGYLIGDEWENESFIKDLMRCNQEILEASRGIVVIWGNVWVDFDKKGEDGRCRKYNAALIANNGKWVSNSVFEGRTYKSLMPKYREFDDERHFYSMVKLALENKKRIDELLKPFDIEINNKRIRLGLILCEDMWCENYDINPTEILVKNGADLIINLSASPWTWRKNIKRHSVVGSILKDNPVPFVYCNNVGIQNNGKNIFLFDGSSTVYDKNGSICLVANVYNEEMLVFKMGGGSKFSKTATGNDDTKELYEGLVYGIRKFFEKIGNKKIVIGLSGGIDSAVSACLLTDALGKENILAVNMPSKFNSDLTKNLAKQLAHNLKIKFKIFPIQKGVDLTKKELEDGGFGVDKKILENIQARDRSSRVLAAIAASIGANFICNSNKTELALGYTTLYGDLDGALAPLADLYKHEVYQLAEYINQINDEEIIPKGIIDLIPSAELSEDQDIAKGQGDPIIYPYHDKLIRAFVEFRKDPEYILELYILGKLESELKIESGLVKKYFPTPKEFIDDLEGKWSLLKKNYFKRIQSPPIIAVSRRAFGYDLRESQNGVYFTNRYIQIKTDLLEK